MSVCWGGVRMVRVEENRVALIVVNWAQNTMSHDHGP